MTDDDLLEFAKNKGATIFHPAGTCKMGPAEDALAVVDPRITRTRRRRAARRRLQHHADVDLRQHERPRHHDRRKGGRHDSARRRTDIRSNAVTKETPMPCCHADFAAVEGSDRGFTVGMPTFTFGAGVLAEAGDHARELGLKRVALFTDARLKASEYVATVASIACGGSCGRGHLRFGRHRAHRRLVPGCRALCRRQGASTVTSPSAAAR